MIDIIVTMPMTSDGGIIPIHKGDLLWTFDIHSDMKVPLTVTKVYEDGSWDGVQAWKWGIA